MCLRVDSDHCSTGYESVALPLSYTGISTHGQARTADILLVRQALSQLSYARIFPVGLYFSINKRQERRIFSQDYNSDYRFFIDVVSVHLRHHTLPMMARVLVLGLEQEWTTMYMKITILIPKILSKQSRHPISTCSKPAILLKAHGT